MRRRTLLTLAPAGLLTGLTGCGAAFGLGGTTVPVGQRVAYGDDPSQFGELHLPHGPPRGVVVVVHGGFWRSAYDLDLGTPLARDLAGRGWAAWNLEYRRVGNGGGVPQTLDDVRAGIAALAGLTDSAGTPLDLTTVVGLGHSAGGHLVTWAAGRGGLTHVISQAGVVDLAAAAAENLGNGAVAAFLGHPYGPADADVDPAAQVPLAVPVWCVHAADDVNVPVSQSRRYVQAARAAGGWAELVELERGGHFTVVDTGSAAWDRQVAILDGIAGPARP